MSIQRYRFDGVDLVKNDAGYWVAHADYAAEVTSAFNRGYAAGSAAARAAMPERFRFTEPDDAGPDFWDGGDTE